MATDAGKGAICGGSAVQDDGLWTFGGSNVDGLSRNVVAGVRTGVTADEGNISICDTGCSVLVRQNQAADDLYLLVNVSSTSSSC